MMPLLSAFTGMRSMVHLRVHGKQQTTDNFDVTSPFATTLVGYLLQKILYHQTHSSR